MRIIALVALFALVGCAQPPPAKKLHVQANKTDLGSRIDIQINYHLDTDNGYVVVDLSNPRGGVVRLWLVQVSETDGQRITAARRFYTGSDKKKQEIFKIPLPQKEVVESFYVEIFDTTGRLVLKSEPIKNSPIGG